MMYLKTPSQVRELEVVNKLGAEFLQMCYDSIKPGVMTMELEELAIKFCENTGAGSAFYKYHGFPHMLCVSVNDEVIHGFPGGYIIKDGDMVSVDFGLIRNGYVSDAAFTKIVGRGSSVAKKLIRTVKECLYKGIEKAVPGNRIHDISFAIQQHAILSGFNVLHDYVGHAVGFELHEKPKVPNYVSLGVNWKLRPGMVIAIEPMLVEGSNKIYRKPNGWTVVTKDRRLSAHYEHSVAILESGPKILSELGG